MQPDATGSYTFSLDTTGQARLLVNGVLAAQVEWDDPSEQFSQPVDLEAGTRVDLTLEYKQGGASGSVIRLEWQRGGAASVVPSAQLSSTGSNLQAAVNTLQADPTFAALSVPLDLEYATGALTPSGYGLVVQHPTEATSYIVTLEDGPNSPIQTLYELAVIEQDNAVFTDLESGRSVAIDNMSRFVDQDGNPIVEQGAALEALLFEFFASTDRNTITTQGLQTQQASMLEIPSCDSCQRYAENLESAYRDHAEAVSITVIGIYAGGIGGAVKDAVSWGTRFSSIGKRVVRRSGKCR